MVDEFQDTNALQVSLIEALGVAERVHGRRRAAVHLRLPPRRRRGLQRASTRPAARPARARHWRPTSARARAILELVNAAFGGVHEGVPWTPLTVPERGGRDERDPAPPARRRRAAADRRGRWARTSSPRRAARRSAAATRPASAAEALLVAAAGRASSSTPARRRRRDRRARARRRSSCRCFERAIERAGLPAVAAQGRGWWARLEVLDLIAHLRLLVNPRDEEGLLRRADGVRRRLGRTPRAARAGRAAAAPRGRRSRHCASAGARGRRRRAGSPRPIGPRARRLYGALCSKRERAAAAWAGPGELIDARRRARPATTARRWRSPAAAPDGQRPQADPPRPRLRGAIAAATCARSSTTRRASSSRSGADEDAPVEVGRRRACG